MDRIRIGARVELRFERIGEYHSPSPIHPDRSGRAMITDYFDVGCRAVPGAHVRAIRHGAAQLPRGRGRVPRDRTRTDPRRTGERQHRHALPEPPRQFRRHARASCARARRMSRSTRATRSRTSIWFMRFTSVGVDLPRTVPSAHRPHAGRGTHAHSVYRADRAHRTRTRHRGLAARSRTEGRATPARDLDDIALIKSSGGTTGRPKAIMQSHRSPASGLPDHQPVHAPAKDPVHLVVAPLTHAAGATAMVALARFGTRNVIAPSTDPGVILEADRARARHAHLPAAHHDLPAAGAPGRRDARLFLARIRALRRRADVGRQAARRPGALGPGVRPVLRPVGGAGRDHLPVAQGPLPDDDPAARQAPRVGRPTVRRLRGGADGRRRQHRRRPASAARSSPAASWSRPATTTTPRPTAEARRFGWHHTGDIGVFDENGYLYVVDRKKDMVISGGFNIYPSEIEQVIWGHPAVQDCAVVGVPDADWGERLTAVIELKSARQATADDIIDMCRKRFGSLKTPEAGRVLAARCRAARSARCSRRTCAPGSPPHARRR